MDLETENRIASILMKEAAELRRQADKEGVHVYLRERNVRFRPNSRFLTATVLGVQQANRVAEVNEMWRVRKKEQELDGRLKGSSRDKRSYMDHNESPRDATSRRIEHNDTLRSSSSGHRQHNSNNAGSSKSQVDGSYSDEDEVDDSYSNDGSLKDEEVQQFLHSRVKRGRGGVGARMDEPGPYLPRTGSDSKNRLLESPDVREREEWECRVLGPEKPPSFRFNRSLEGVNEDNWEKAKKPKVESSKKLSKKHTRKEDKRAKKERKERKSKHKHKSKHRSSH